MLGYSTCINWSMYDHSRCDYNQALNCEIEYINCKNSNIANNTQINCECATIFFGKCLPSTHCLFTMNSQSIFYTNSSSSYFRTCIHHLVDNNCQNPSFCYLNCVPSDSSVTSIFLTQDTNTKKNTFILPINNYGKYYLQISLCNKGVNRQILTDFRQIYPDICSPLQFTYCPTWIPPSTFLLAVIPTTTTYLLISYCNITMNGSSFCYESNPLPSKVFANSLKWTTSFDTPVSLFCDHDGSESHKYSYNQYKMSCLIFCYV